MNDIAIPRDPMEEFRDKIKARVRDDIRDLLPEAAVASLVQKAVEEEFFKPRDEKTDRYPYTQKRPSWFMEEVVKAARPIMEAAVRQAIADHPHVVEKAIRDFLQPQQLAILTTSELTGMLHRLILDVQQKMMQL